MTANRTTAVLFALFAMALAWASANLPSGVGAVPGPAFFPLTIAAAIALLAAALMVQASPAAEAPQAAPAASRRVAGVIGLLFLYLLLWGTGLFALRTVIFLCLLLRWTGQGWRASAGVAATLTAVVVLAFQVGLRVSLE